MRWLIPVLATLTVTLAAAPRRAEACGGTFCDVGPQIMPVDQAFETVLFIQDGPFVEAHIQIAIDPATEAQKFAWLVPMPAAPTFAVGSQPLFDALLAATSPSYRTRGESCFGDDGGVAFIQNPDGGGASRDPELHTETVGAFEVTTIEGGSVAAVLAWLDDNGYAQDPAAEPILAEYLDAGHVLVAFKLVPSASTAEVHPIVLRYQGDEACVPIKLTAIAAQDDMGVRTFFLGESRFAPANYRHVALNPVRLPWDGFNGSYAAAVTLAVDEAPAGHGFVTEYAGPADVVVPTGVHAVTWDATPFATAEPTTVVDLLNAQGLADCGELGPCSVPHPLVVAMLRKYLPAPLDVNENDFYACLSCYADQTDFADWDGPAFAAELAERVIAPGEHAVGLLAAWPYLTRMFTTISPHEMTVDPTFHANTDLPDVPVPAAAQRTCVECEGDAVITLPDGRMVYAEGDAWPSFSDAMPWAERIETVPPAGAPMVEVDNAAAIDAALGQWNGKHECMPGGSGSGSGGDSDGSADGGGSGLSGTGGSDSSGSGEGAGADGDDDDALGGRGCACNGAGGSHWAWTLLGVAGVASRRRYRRSSDSATRRSNAGSSATRTSPRARVRASVDR